MTYDRRPLTSCPTHLPSVAPIRSNHNRHCASRYSRATRDFCSSCFLLFSSSAALFASSTASWRSASAPLCHPPSNAFLKHQRPEKPHRKAFPMGPSRAKASYASTTGAATPTVFLVPSAVSQESGRIGKGPSMKAKLPAINTSTRPATITDHQATMGDRSWSVFAANQNAIQANMAMMNNQNMKGLYHG